MKLSLRWAIASMVLCASVSLPVRADYVAEVLKDNPVAYWRLGETDFDSPIVDLTGNVPNGEWDDFGGLEFGFDGAIVGDNNSAVKFAEPSNFSCGLCSRGAIPVGGVLDLGTVDSDQVISLEAWFKILPSVDEGLPITSFPRIFHYNNFEGGQYAFGLVGDNNAGFPGQRTIWAGRGDGTDSGVVILTAETDMVPPGLEEEWFHFVALLERDEVRLFLNGEELVDLFDSDPVFWQSEQATIGARVQADGTTLTQPFPGLIDELAIYNTLLSPERIRAHYLAGIGEGVTIDIDSLQAAIRAGENNASFDLTGDGLVNAADQDFFVRETLNTWTGDSNLDGEFNSSDFVFVFQKGEYEDGIASNSTWADGDWNADAEFDSSDFVRAFQEGGYEQGPRAAVAAVPEPTGAMLLLAGMLLLPIRRRRA